MARLTNEERKQKLNNEIEQRKLKLKEIAKKEKAGLRKVRTHRLCEIAGELASKWPQKLEMLTDAEFAVLMENVRDYANKYEGTIRRLCPARKQDD